MIDLIDYSAARAIAEDYLDREVRADEDDEVIIVDVGILETPSVWVFPYDTRIYVETLEAMHALVGNVPVIVPKDGATPWTPFSGLPLEDQIADFDKARNVFGEGGT